MAPSNESDPASPTKDPGSAPVSPGIVKSLVVAEDDGVPVLGMGVKLLRWLGANMMMYVCVKG